MVTARLGLVIVYRTTCRLPGIFVARSPSVTRRWRWPGDWGTVSRSGYALNARMHALWDVGAAPERLATGTELGEIADDIGDELLAVHGHMWRIRELLAQGHVDSVNEEIARFRARDSGPVHPLEASYAFNVMAMMALLEGQFERAEQLGQHALEVSEGHNELALSFYGALMLWTWWQRGDLTGPGRLFREVVAQTPTEYHTVPAALALVHAEAGDVEASLVQLRSLAELGWENVADDQTEGVSLAMAAAACGMLGALASDFASPLHEAMRRYAGTVIVVRGAGRRLPGAGRPLSRAPGGDHG